MFTDMKNSKEEVNVEKQLSGEILKGIKATSGWTVSWEAS